MGTDFVYDTGSVPETKSDLKPLKAGALSSNYWRSVDANLIQADLTSIRNALLGGQYYGLSNNTSAPLSGAGQAFLRSNSGILEVSSSGGAYASLVVALTAVGSVGDPNGASITGGTLQLRAATSTTPGVMTTTTQQFTGNKQFDSIGIGTAAPGLGNMHLYGTPGVDGSLKANLLIGDNNTFYNASPKTGIDFAVNMSSGGGFTGCGGIGAGKENSGDGNTASYVAIYTRPNSSSVTEVARWSSGGRFLIGTTSDDGTHLLQVNGSSTMTALTLSVTPLALSSGGSGQTTAQASMNTFAGAVTSGQYLRGNGTNVVMSAIQAADLPNPGASSLGGVQSFAATTHQFLTQISTSGVVSAAQPAFTDISGTVAATQLPNPSASTLGGVQSFASVSHQFITQISTSGVVSAAQPAFSDISGSVSAAQLPNPSASTLGGVQSYASVSHQWINAISTSGVPSSSQPAFTDISGSVAAGQLPNPGASSLGGVQSFASVSHQFLTQISTAGVVSAAQPATTDLSDFPSQTSNSGKFLTTNGTTLSWASASGTVGGTGTSGQIAAWSGSSTIGNPLCTLTATANGLLVGSNTDDTVGVLQVTGTQTFPGTGSATLRSGTSDGGTAIAWVLNTKNTLSTAGALHTEWSNNGTMIATMDQNGWVNTTTMHPVLGKRTGEYSLITTSDVVFTASGLPSPLTQGTVSAAPAADSNYMMLKFLTGSSSGNAAGISGPYTVTRSNYLPRVSYLVRTDSAVTSQRIYIGITDADLSGATTLAGTNSTHYIAFRYDTTIGDTNWMAVSSDGTTASATSTGVAVAANTTYTLMIDFSVSGTAQFKINNPAAAQVLKTTNLPGSAINMGLQASITTLTSSGKALYIARAALEQN